MTTGVSAARGTIVKVPDGTPGLVIVNNPQSPTTGGRGLLGFLGLISIAAPFARLFVQHVKAVKGLKR